MWRLVVLLALSPHCLALPGKVKRHTAGVGSNADRDRWETAMTRHQLEAPPRLMAQDGDKSMRSGDGCREYFEENQKLREELAYFGHQLMVMGNNMITSGMEVLTDEQVEQQREFMSRTFLGLFGGASFGLGGSVSIKEEKAGPGETTSKVSHETLSSSKGNHAGVGSNSDSSGKMSVSVDGAGQPAGEVDSDGSKKFGWTFTGGPGPQQKGTDSSGKMTGSLGGSRPDWESAGGSSGQGTGISGTLGGQTNSDGRYSSSAGGGTRPVGGSTGSSAAVHGSVSTEVKLGMSSGIGLSGRNMPLYDYYEGMNDSGMKGLKADVWVEPSQQVEE